MVLIRTILSTIWIYLGMYLKIWCRDLLVFAEKHNARVMHYTDDMGVEADAVYQLEDGRYALIEIKTGVNKIPEAEKSLLRFKDIILKYNEKALEKKNIHVMYIKNHRH